MVVAYLMWEIHLDVNIYKYMYYSLATNIFNASSVKVMGSLIQRPSKGLGTRLREGVGGKGGRNGWRNGEMKG